MKRWLCVLPLLWTTASFAQRGGGGGAPPRQAPTLTPDEKARAATAIEWKDMIERARANLPQHPPDHAIKFPSKNLQFLSTLRFAENPRAEMEKFLAKLWTDVNAVDLVAKQRLLDLLWQEADKPLWARVAIEEYFKKKSNGLALHPVEEAAAPSPGPKTAANEPATTQAPPATTQAPTPASTQAAATKAKDAP